MSAIRGAPSTGVLRVSKINSGELVTACSRPAVTTLDR